MVPVRVSRGLHNIVGVCSFEGFARVPNVTVRFHRAFWTGLQGILGALAIREET